MKKIKLLTSLIALPILGTSLLPLVACNSKKEETEGITVISSKSIEIQEGTTADYKFKTGVKPYDSKIKVTIENTTTEQKQLEFKEGNGLSETEVTVDDENKFILHIGFVDEQTSTCESKFKLTFSYKKDEASEPTTFNLEGFTLKFVNPTEIQRTITFQVSGEGRLEGELQVKVLDGKTWADVKKPTPVDQSTVVFTGWFNGNVEMKDTDLIKSDLTITAKFINCTPTSCFEFSYGSGGATLNSCVQSEIKSYQDIIIPECVTKEGVTYKVNEIAADAFANAKTTMKKVTISKNVKTIGNGAFKDCSLLNTVTLPEGLETIAAEAFYSCAFTTVTIPSTTTFIGSSAFSGSSVLSSIHLADKTHTWQYDDAVWQAYYSSDEEAKTFITSITSDLNKTDTKCYITITADLDASVTKVSFPETIDYDKDFTAVYTYSQSGIYYTVDILVDGTSIVDKSGVITELGKVYVPNKYMTTPNMTVSIKLNETPLLTNTWQEIIDACNKFENKEITQAEFVKCFKTKKYQCVNISDLIGAQMPIEINGLTHYVRITGTKRSYIWDETEQKQTTTLAALTFELVTLLSDSSGNAMTSKWDATNNFDYTNSILRWNLNGTGTEPSSGVWSTKAIDMLPAELTASGAIKTVVKSCAKSEDSGASYIETSYQDKLFPITCKEMNNQLQSLGEGIPYEYWKNHDANTYRIKKDFKGNAKNYWLASPIIVDDTHRVYIVSTAGGIHIDLYYSQASFTNGVSFAFCI